MGKKEYNYDFIKKIDTCDQLVEVVPVRRDEYVFVCNAWEFQKAEDEVEKWYLSEFDGIFERDASGVSNRQHRLFTGGHKRRFIIKREDFNPYDLEETFDNMIVAIGDKMFKGLNLYNTADSYLLEKLAIEFDKVNNINRTK